MFNTARIEKMGKDQDIAQRTAEFQDRMARYAREVSAEMFPEGMTFSDLERAAVAVGDQVSREIMQERVRTRARSDEDRPPANCPKCGGPLDEGPRRQRGLGTTRGEVTWTERTQRCPRCRRAFSPSRPNDGA